MFAWFGLKFVMVVPDMLEQLFWHDYSPAARGKKVWQPKTFVHSNFLHGVTYNPMVSQILLIVSHISTMVSHIPPLMSDIPHDV